MLCRNAKTITMESKMTHEESLKIIQQMVANPRHNWQEDSRHYLLWGWLALSAGLIEYTLLAFTNSPYHWVTWPVLMSLGGVVSVIMSKQQRLQKKHTTQLDLVMKYVWSGIVVAILFSLIFASEIGWSSAYIFLIILYGLGTFISGGVLKFKPLIYGGIASWLLALFGMFSENILVDFKGYLLLLCLSLIVSYLIPGYLLKNAKEA